MQAKVQIEQVVNKTKEETPQGKKYTVHEWECSGYINGEWTDSFIVKTLSNKASQWIVDGFSFTADVDNAFGLKYVIPKAMYAMQSAPQRQAPQAPQAQRKTWPPQKTQPPAQQPQQGYTAQDIVDLFEYSFNEAMRISPTSEARAQVAMAATMFIAMKNESIKAQHKPTQQEKIKPPAQEAAEINPSTTDEMIQQAGLEDRVLKADVPDHIIKQWWKDSNQNKKAFISRIINELEEAGY